MSKITTSDALQIEKKLKATIITNRKAHDRACIFHNGYMIASFGIRRGSGDHGHGHVPSGIRLGPHDTKRLAECTISREEWIKRLNDEGLIPAP